MIEKDGTGAMGGGGPAGGAGGGGGPKVPSSGPVLPAEAPERAEEPALEGPLKAEAGVDWFFVLTAPVTKFRDKMMLLEADGVSFAPVFREKAAGEAFLRRLAPPEEYSVQAMHRLDIEELAASQRAEALVLDGEGRILAGIEGVAEGREAAAREGSQAQEGSGGGAGAAQGASPAREGEGVRGSRPPREGAPDSPGRPQGGRGKA
ncbi:MAG: hypothetical protein LBW85_03190 [Deltaproteobacteria bacterium]|jgi:hypothetical protein|nr:hypothetical protein [Deltaproteobacteria bacterium]